MVSLHNRFRPEAGQEDPLNSTVARLGRFSRRLQVNAVGNDGPTPDVPQRPGAEVVHQITAATLSGPEAPWLWKWPVKEIETGVSVSKILSTDGSPSTGLRTPSLCQVLDGSERGTCIVGSVH